MAAWQVKRAAMARAGGWDAKEREWEASVDARTDALRQLIEYPLDTVAQISEKVGIAVDGGEHLDEDDLSLLVTAIAADLGRVSGRA